MILYGETLRHQKRNGKNTHSLFCKNISVRFSKNLAPKAQNSPGLVQVPSPPPRLELKVVTPGAQLAAATPAGCHLHREPWTGVIQNIHRLHKCIPSSHKIAQRGRNQARPSGQKWHPSLPPAFDGYPPDGHQQIASPHISIYQAQKGSRKPNLLAGDPDMQPKCNPGVGGASR